VALGIEVHRRLKTWTSGVSVFVALSQFARQKFVEAGLPAGRIRVKPNFVLPPSRTREGAGSHVLFLGRLSQEKGVDLLLGAWSESLGRLLIAGDGPARLSLEKQTVSHGDSIEFLGALSRERCMDLLRDARALVVPSRWYEGFPVVIAEAYAHGVPVIGPALGVFPEIVSHRETGLLFAPRDAASLAARIQELKDPATSIRMGHNARRRYEERYTPQRNLELLLDVYERAIRREVA
jgi:glycosyltransferase involved in cell wall biosynthesis